MINNISYTINYDGNTYRAEVSLNDIEATDTIVLDKALELLTAYSKRILVRLADGETLLGNYNLGTIEKGKV